MPITIITDSEELNRRYMNVWGNANLGIGYAVTEDERLAQVFLFTLEECREALRVDLSLRHHGIVTSGLRLQPAVRDAIRARQRKLETETEAS